MSRKPSDAQTQGSVSAPLDGHSLASGVLASVDKQSG